MFVSFSPADLIWMVEIKLNVTCFFLMSLRAAMSSGASEGTLVTTPVPEENTREAKGQHIKCIYTNQIVCFSQRCCDLHYTCSKISNVKHGRPTHKCHRSPQIHAHSLLNTALRTFWLSHPDIPIMATYVNSSTGLMKINRPTDKLQAWRTTHLKTDPTDL